LELALMQKNTTMTPPRAGILALGLAAVACTFAGCGSGTRVATTDLRFTFKSSAGSDVSLKLPCTDYCSTNLRGKVVLVNFWATWCEACKAEIPSLIEFQHENGNKGFTVLGIAMDESGAKVVEPFVRETRFDADGRRMAMNYPIVIGSDSVADKFGGLWAYPTSVLITRDGRIAKRIVGTVSPDDLKEIEALIGS
jgi:thiol-disulfide isomerase/thioredoxin